MPYRMLHLPAWAWALAGSIVALLTLIASLVGFCFSQVRQLKPLGPGRTYDPYFDLVEDVWTPR